MRQVTAVLLAVMLASPSAPMVSAAATADGTVRGAVTLGARPLGGATLAFVDLATGLVHRTASDPKGRFTASLPAGQYVVAAESAAGLTVDRAPGAIAVAPGQTVVADIGLMTLASASPQELPPAAMPTPADPNAPPSAPVTATTIGHDPIGCMIAGQFPLIPARLEPAASVARARVFFRSASSPNWYYVEMTPSATAGFEGKLPRPKLEASPILYYVQATTTEFGDAQTPEISAIVVNEASECEDKKIAPIGGPGEVTVFSASTGAAVAPLGFAAGGLALTLGTILLVVAGAAAAGLTAAVTVFNPDPTPSPGASPTPIPPGEPLPTSTPSPSPSPSPEPTPPPATPFR